jgi:hypothetical protein
MKRFFCYCIHCFVYWVSLTQIALIAQSTGQDGLKVEDTTQNVGYSTGRFSSRYFLVNSALPTRKGEGYMNFSFFGPELQYAVADNLMVGAWSSWVGMPVGLQAKYTVSGQNAHAGLGIAMGSTTYTFPHVIFTLPYAAMTFGNPQNHLSINLGVFTTHLQRKIQNPQSNLPESYWRNTYGMHFSSTLFIKAGTYSSFIFEVFYVSRYAIREFEYVPVGGGMGNISYQLREYRDTSFPLLALGPGIRRQKSDLSAYQLGLGLLIGYAGLSVPIPVPMFSYFRKFG